MRHAPIRRLLPLIAVLSGCAAPASGGFAPSGTVPAVPGGSASGGPSASPLNAQAPPQSVLDAYREFHRALEAALATDDPSPLPPVTAEPLASRLTALVEDQRRSSVVRRTHLALNPRLAWIRHDTALVLDCVYSPGLTTFDAATGRRRGPRPVAEQALVETTLKLESSWLKNTWKVARVSEAQPC